MTDENTMANNKAVAIRPQVSSIQPLFDTDHFEHMQRAASALMHSTLLKESIRGPSPQACFSNLMLIFEQAQRFGLPATTVAQNVDVVYGQLVYRGVLVAAMIEAKLGKLYRHYTGERGADDYRVYICDRDFGELSDEVLASLKPGKYPRGLRIVDGSVAEWRTFQKAEGGASRQPNPAWVGRNTQPQLGYRGDREWARFYEPSILLGVYGDDEIAAYARILSVETIVDEDDAPITSGFAGDAKADPSAADDGKAAPQTAAEATGSHTTDKTAGGAAPAPLPQDDGKPAPRRQSAADKEAQRQAKVREETEARMAAGEAAEVEGKRAGLAGEGGDTYAATYTPEEVRHWKNGWNVGNSEREALVVAGDDEDEGNAGDGEELGAAAAAEKEAAAQREVEADGFATGLAGKACQVPLGVADDMAGAWRSAWTNGDAERVKRQEFQLQAADLKTKTAAKPAADKRSGSAVAAYEAGHRQGLAGATGETPRAWTEFADDFSEGWNAGAAERLQDASGDGDDEADEEDSPPANPFDLFASQITGYASWKDEKAALGQLAKTDEWKADLEDGGYRVRSARVSAGVRLTQLINENVEPADLITHDLQAFRCWSEMTDDPELIEAKYPELVLGPIWDGLDANAQQTFERVIKARVASLRGK